MKKMPVKVRLPWKHNVPSTMAVMPNYSQILKFWKKLEKFSNPLSYALSGTNYLLAVLNVKSLLVPLRTMIQRFTLLFSVQASSSSSMLKSNVAIFKCLSVCFQVANLLKRRQLHSKKASETPLKPLARQQNLLAI